MDEAVNLSCEEITNSPDRIELIVVRDETRNPRKKPLCVLPVNDRYEIWYYDRRDMPPLSVFNYTYGAIPKCFCLLENDSLEVSGILRLSEQPTLSLKGQGVFVAIPDTGNGENDTNGHGSLIASIVSAGVPLANVLSIKLKEAPVAIKEFYHIPNSAAVYTESEIMLAVEEARRQIGEDTALVTCIGLGTNSGTHAGTLPICEYLDQLAMKRHQAVVVAMGNEANAAHHFVGSTQSMLSPARVEINVENDMEGFTMELVSAAPQIVTAALISPTGELVPRGGMPQAANQEYEFLFEGTRVSIDYENVGRGRRDVLTFFRFTNVKKGIWTLLVYPYNVINGEFQVWLPMEKQLESPVYFLNANPDITLTTPSDARQVISVGGYQARNGSLYIDSGRGYTLDNRIKPDIVAPAVNVEGKNRRGDLELITGTSAAAAIASAACAQILEWAVTRKNALGINSADVKNLLIRGAKRKVNQEYPSNTFGYGELDVYNSFEQMRGK